MITRNFNLYLNAGHSVPLVINVNQYDSGEQWVFTLYNADGTKYTPSTGAIVGIKSDGLGIINSGSVVDGNVVINETQQMTAAVGKAVFELMIDSQTHGTANFVVLVEEKPGNNADLSESDLSLLQEAIDATSPLPTGGSVGQVLTKTANGSAWSDAGTPTQEQVADAVSDWADEHITVTTGVVIDTSLSVAGAAADSKKVGDEITDLKSAFQNIGYTEEVSANLLNPSELEAGRITSSSSAVLHTGTYDTDYRTTGFMPVEAGKKYGFYVKTTLGDIVNCAVANIWSYDDSKAGLSYLGTISYNASGTTYITAPANAKYVRASLVAGSFTNFEFVQFSETEGTAPSALVQYQKDIYLSGYVQTAELEATNAEVNEIKTVIDDNFTDVYEPITDGTTADNKYINTYGVVADISSAYNTTIISASAGDKFKVTAKAYLNAYYYGFFDSTDTLIEGLKSTQSGTTEINDVAVVAPANTAYLVAVGYATYATIKGVTGQVVNSAVPWTGKKWVCVGDSLTERNVTTTKNYYDYISEASGITPYIMGVGGSGYVRGYDVTKAFYQRISAVPTDADFVTIFGSGNDLNIEAMDKFSGKTWAEALGTYTDTGTDTICGCVNTCLDNYFAVMVTAPIGIIAPSPWRPYPTTTPSNRMSDYVSALKQIAEYRGVPFLDLYHCSNLRPENQANRAACYYDGELDGNGDGVHPNALGHQIIASKIYQFVKNLLID